MLSRTADHLFWMARYVERAENTARMLDVNVTTSLLPMSREAAERGWRAMLGISELQPAFDARHDSLDAHDVLAADTGGRARLAQEPCDGGRVRRDLRLQHLHGDAPIEVQVGRLEDVPHTAFSEEPLDAELAGEDLSRLRTSRFHARREA